MRIWKNWTKTRSSDIHRDRAKRGHYLGMVRAKDRGRHRGCDQGLWRHQAAAAEAACGTAGGNRNGRREAPPATAELRMKITSAAALPCHRCHEARPQTGWISTNREDLLRWDSGVRFCSAEPANYWMRSRHPCLVYGLVRNSCSAPEARAVTMSGTGQS